MCLIFAMGASSCSAPSILLLQRSCASRGIRGNHSRNICSSRDGTRRTAGGDRLARAAYQGKTTMKVGIFVTNQNPLGTDMVSALDEQFAMTRLARDRGWDAVGTGQHYLSEGMSQLQLIPFLARLAAEAGEMTGVAGVLLINLHNPVDLAECVASLDVIWRGNFVFGVGLGYREVEFDAFKVPKGQRLRRFREWPENGEPLVDRD